MLYSVRQLCPKSIRAIVGLPDCYYIEEKAHREIRYVNGNSSIIAHNPIYLIASVYMYCINDISLDIR